jgi:hypothetical protein
VLIPLEVRSHFWISKRRKMIPLVANTLTRSSARSLVQSRPFGALTQKSWGNHSLLSDKKNLFDMPSLQGRADKTPQTNVLLDSLFSRRFILPNAIHNVDFNKLEAIFSAQQPHDVIDPGGSNAEEIQAKRNTRRPTKSNHGARPCSRAGRRKKKEAIGKRRRSY